MIRGRSTASGPRPTIGKLIEEFGYAAPQQAVTRFSRLVPDRPKADFGHGCGTGLAGQLLAKGAISI
ncbi:MAG: hypothetical protein Ct9H300mP16_17400 [Pseudomonadota bacterium]|nr:MAG: hypothetical protein Ct9H300mP16_17400 [Pseudomonadota bacterium]